MIGVRTQSNRTEKGLTQPTPNGTAAALSNPYSLEVNNVTEALRTHSCPAKCIALANVMQKMDCALGDEQNVCRC